MKTLDLADSFRMLPNKIQGTGVEVFLVDSPSALNDLHPYKLSLHTLIIMLDGSVGVGCDGVRESVQRNEAIMLKKDSLVQFTIPVQHRNSFRSLILFFDEPTLRYALLPFELPAASSGPNVLKIPLNEKIKVFTDSILFYYKSTHQNGNWTILLQNKLRELVWIFFHTELKHEAQQFFSTTR
ncbi:MAG TPA: hypothetical protein VGD65_18020 [Chryseosolibacter sp.]